MMRSLERAACVVAVLALAAGASAAPADELGDGAPFSATPAALLAAGAAAPPPGTSAVVVLLEEGEFRFEADGRCTSRYRLVYRVDKDEAREEWSSVSISWAPWHQERPEVRARVIDRQGAEHPLDPATITEAGLGNEDEDVYSDRRQLDAPLPGFAVGAVVEQQTVVRDTAPLFAGGKVSRFYFGSAVSMRKVRLVLDAPAGLPVRWAAFLLPGLQPRREEAGGRVRLVFETADLAPLANQEAGLPPDVPRWPYVAFSTGTSWAEIARAYGAVVDRQLQGHDLTAMAREAAGDARERPLVVQRLLARVHQEARYTAMELGEASIVPRTPAEVLKRKYGDCKDKATLLVGMLRALGIRAHVALLSSGVGEDVLPELPGMGSFDHAIVHVPGSPELWVDATVERARAGELPISDQGRLALVAAADTKGLARTPETTAADNGSVETREFFMSELGPARVVETTEYHGAHERSFRDSYSGGDLEKQRTQLRDYVRDEYAADDLGLFERGDADQLTRPFFLRVEAVRAARGTAAAQDAVVSVFPAGLTDELPKSLLGDTDETKDAKRTESVKKRVAPYFFGTPFFAEYRYRIVPPPGFTLAELPPSREVPLGPGRFTETWTAAADGMVLGTLRFESGPRRISAEQYEQLKASVREFRELPRTDVRFVQVGQAHLAAGRVKEALQEFARLAALHPGEALHHTQAALALLENGLGEAARAEARRAVEEEPGSALAHQRLGWVLQHDLVGRRFERGFDMQGALAAQREAVRLDPKDLHFGFHLAFLLEHDAEGERWSPRAPLGEAADQYWRLSRELGEHKSNLVHALLRSGRSGELRAAVDTLAEGEVRESLQVLVAAALDGAPAGVRRAGQIADVKARREALVESADTLLRVRRYPEASALLKAAAQGAPNAAELRARSDALARVRKHEDLPAIEPGPAGVVRAFLRDIVLGTDQDKVIDLFHKEERAERERYRRLDVFASTRPPQRRHRRNLELTRDVHADVTLGEIEPGVEGDDAAGYRVRFQVADAGGPRTRTFYVVREDVGYRILGARAVDLAGEAVRRADRGDMAGARRLLDWAREEAAADAGDPFAADPLALFWTAGQQAEADAARLAAASVMVNDSEQASEGLAILAARRARAKEPAETLRLDAARLAGYATLERHADVLAMVEQLSPSHASSEALFTHRMAALSGLRRWKDLERLAGEKLRAVPGHVSATRALLSALRQQGSFAEVERLCAAFLDSGRAAPADFNNCGWNGLFVDGPRQAALARVRRAVEMSGRKDTAYLHTLAALHADAGQYAEAREIILEAINAREAAEEPQPDDWYVIGRIAEGYGLDEAARAAYARVRPSPDADATWVLAQRRIKAMKTGVSSVAKSGRGRGH